MPITIDPAHAAKPTDVTLSNTLGYPVLYKITVTTCAGKTLGASDHAETLATGKTATSHPTSTAPRLVTFTVERASASAHKGLQTQVALTSRQGCTLAAKPHPAVLPAQAGKSVAVAAPVSHGLPIGALGGVALGVLVLAALIVRLVKRPRHGGSHSR